MTNCPLPRRAARRSAIGPAQLILERSLARGIAPGIASVRRDPT
jgi:hypothetical protein